MLQALVEQHPALCRRLLKRGGSSGALCQALLRERLWSEKLYGVLPEYDRWVWRCSERESAAYLCFAQPTLPGPVLPRLPGSCSAALAEVLSAPADSRLKGMQAAMAGYRVGGADGSTFWDVKREMGSADYRRWPPAVQAQLRQLASAVAGEASAHAGARVAAVCLLLRLQVRVGCGWRPGWLAAIMVDWNAAGSCTYCLHAGLLSLPLRCDPACLSAVQDATVAELEPLVDDSQLTAACLLAASLLPDKRQAAHFLQSKVGAQVARPARHLVPAFHLAVAACRLPEPSPVTFPLLCCHACS